MGGILTKCPPSEIDGNVKPYSCSRGISQANPQHHQCHHHWGLQNWVSREEMQLGSNLLLYNARQLKADSMETASTHTLQHGGRVAFLSDRWSSDLWLLENWARSDLLQPASEAFLTFLHYQLQEQTTCPPPTHRHTPAFSFAQSTNRFRPHTLPSVALLKHAAKKKKSGSHCCCPLPVFSLQGDCREIVLVGPLLRKLRAGVGGNRERERTLQALCVFTPPSWLQVAVTSK